MDKKKLIRLTIGLIILSFIGFLINESFGSFIMFLSWIIIGISCYKYKKEKEKKEIITMGKYKNFILKDNTKAYILIENNEKETVSSENSSKNR